MASRTKPRAREAQLAFEALSIEGGLLSPEWLSKVAQLVAGTQSEADYRIPKGLNLRDEIGRYWRIGQAHWNELAAGRQAHSDVRGLAERFLTGLLRDSFGFISLAPIAPIVVAERSFPIGHAALSGRVPLVIADAGSGLDSLTSKFGDGGRRRSAFGLAQEYLNAQESAMWGLASDGLTLRALRDNASLTRPAWVEVDLARIFTEERYADFAALWLLLHETRFGREGQPIVECALEVWRNAGREEGTRAREHLRRGVEDALHTLGQGFLSHPDNQAVRTALQSGELSAKDYFNQLLRLVYRIIFLLTVEERGLLYPEGTPDAAKVLYTQGYGLRRLRERAVKRSAHDRFSDLWESTKIVFRGLTTGEPRLGLPALAGIFATSQCAALDAARLENRALLLAVFKLAWLREDGSLARVNWRDMGPEELGSVYESLLELVPQITKDGRQFAFATGGETKGNARKTTGSYYTPDSLVQVLLDSALEPVIAGIVAMHPDRADEALLDLSIVDPACGSGHFLLAAARRLAAHVARLQANGTPSAAEYRHALRQVVGRCIYGVDLNPMAVELCKVSLWMEAIEPGLPLTFLNSHIQHGNALLGATPDLMAKGVPDAAWDPIEGDDNKTASALKKRNKKAAEGQRSFDTLWSKPTDTEAQSIARAVAELDAASDTSVEALAKKEARWESILCSPEYRHQKFVADAWCAAFVWPKQSDELTGAAPTNELWRQLRDGQGQAPALTTKRVGELAEQYRFFHWHLQFPQVFAKSGFDVVLGNPPWEKVRLLEQEFFASRSDEIARAPNAASRKKLIASLPRTNPALWVEWCSASRLAEGQIQLVRASDRYPLCGRGDVNTYAIFAEHDCAILGSRGRAGFIVPTGVATDDTTKEFFGAIVSTGCLVSLFDFENAKPLFVGVDRRFRFSLLTVSKSPFAGTSDFAFYLRDPSELGDPFRHFSLSADDFETLNPNTRTCPTFRSRRDAEINLTVYRRAGVLCRDDRPNGNPWQIEVRTRLWHMTEDVAFFRGRSELETAGWFLDGNLYLRGGETATPLYEAKMVHHFDHRYGDYADKAAGSQDTQLMDVPVARLNDPRYQPISRYWVSKTEVEKRLHDVWTYEWLLGWRDITNATNERSVIASLMPRVAVGNTTPLLMPSVTPSLTACLYACLCSFALDYTARQKIGGTHLNFLQFKQLPVLVPSAYEVETPWERGTVLREWFLVRVLELAYTSWDIEPFARDIGYVGTPFRWSPERRFQIRCELDAALFHLYELSRDDTDFVMDTFPIVRKSDEKTYGEYRTKRVILEVFDALAKASRTGTSYRTTLDPLPGAPGASHGTFSSDGTPRDYAEALRTGLLFTIVFRSGESGVSVNVLSRALLWLQDSKHAAAWMDQSGLAEFERIRDSDSLLAAGAVDSNATKLLDALETSMAITRDSKGIVRLRAGGSIPKWLPQTPTLAKLASVMIQALERADEDAGAAPVITKLVTRKVTGP